MDSMEKLVSLCKRRGFIFPSSEVYGGLNGCWDYGPLGVELKRNVKEAWWRDMVTGHDDLDPPPGAPSAFSMVGLDCSILMNPKVWEASGHVGGFSDPMVDCRECKARFREDQIWLIEAVADDEATPWKTVIAATSDEAVQPFADSDKERKRAEKKLKGAFSAFQAKAYADRGDDVHAPCPACGAKESLTEPRAFNLMFKTHVGALEDHSSIAYLRPETAQGIFVNFKNVCDTARVRIPFGIAQLGKAFRNEINPRNFTFRSREFEQMEIEFFCTPDSAPQWYRYWRDRRFAWYVDLGLQTERLRLREHESDELAHYAAGCADVEYRFPFGVSELEGIANRTDFDLKQHTEHSGKDLRFFDDQAADKELRKYLPYVIEPSAGADRATLAFLCEAYGEEEVGGEIRTVMKFHPRLAPVKAAVFPLVKKDGMPEKAKEIYRALRPHMNVAYDEKGAIGRRYRRQDEIGTPVCVTVDGQTLQDQTVTVRDRDTLAQERIAVDAVLDYVSRTLRTWGQ